MNQWIRQIRNTGFEDELTGTGQDSIHSEPALARGLRPADIRRANRALILAVLARDGPTSRVALALQTGLSRVTVGAIITDLLRDGSVRAVGAAPSTPAGGRRATLVCLSDRASAIALYSPHGEVL